MKKRMACLMITVLLIVSTVISPVYASGVALPESSSAAEGQNSLENQQNGNSGESAGESDEQTDESQEKGSSEQPSGSPKEENTPVSAVKSDESENGNHSSGDEGSNDYLSNSGQTNDILNGRQSEKNPPVAADKAGQIDISIGAALLLERDVEFTVALSSGSTEVDNQKVTLAADNTESDKISFTGLEIGNYTLKVTAPGFADYTQTIQVSQNGYAVKLLTGMRADCSYVAGEAHPGVLLIGDVNKDGQIDDNDKNILVDAIDSGKSSEDSICDLNGDGAMDLADLEYYAKGYEIFADDNIEKTASLEKFVSPAAIQVSENDSTTITGKVENLFNSSSEGVTLAPASEEGSSEPISEKNSVSLEFDFSPVSSSEDDKAAEYPKMDGIVIGVGSNEDNQISDAMITITVVKEDGTEEDIEVPISSESVAYAMRDGKSVSVTVAEDGTISVNLGGQVAVKKVTFTIVGTKKNTNLAEISTVEFVNGMENRIPEPQLSIPSGLKAAAGDKNFSLSWSAETNITGYEVLIKSGNQSQTIQVAGNSLEVTSFAGKELRNYTTYTVSVQSVNGSWRSGYSDSVTVTPKPSKKPDKPDNVKATGKYQSIQVSWKNMEDTQSYNLYYKKRGTDDDYTKITGITTNSYTITGLEQLVEYELYVTGVNEFGESSESLHCTATTTDLNLAVVPQYGVINYSDEEGTVSNHIVSAATTSGTMRDSALDSSSGTAWGTVDEDGSSYYYRDSWDDGGYNALGSRGITYEFDDSYEIDTIRLRQHSGAAISFVKIKYWNEDGTTTELASRNSQCSVSSKKDSLNRAYCEIKLNQPITTNKMQIGFAIYPQGGSSLTISDIYFYHYDTLMDEVMSLYEDDLHTVLKENTTQEVIDALRDKVNATDEISGENHPNQAALLTELETAEKLLNDEKVKDTKTVEVYTSINTADTARGFSGLNAWQPLGVTAAAGEEITVYVGSNTQKTGASTNIRLYITQYHSEHDKLELGWYSNLKVGANTFTMPNSTLSGQEGGGALYVEYRGSAVSTRYAVRVSGGVQVPVLNLYKVTDEDERLAKVTAYVEELETYVAGMEELHEEVHKNSDNKNVQYNYDERNCILGAADIMLDTMMLSLPAQQMLKGCGEGDTAAKAEKMLQSLDAIEEMMYLFYQHKGLNSSASAAIDRIPCGHQNIRYQRMFSGAFMYAGSNHVGIEYPQASIMMGGVPVTSEDGKYISGNYFGWGIAHEIGHCINQDQYEVEEITNNYFAQLSMAKDTNDGIRWGDYQKVYDKVTSGTLGQSPNGAVQLALYWQLHLAYDTGYNYKTYDNYTEQLANLFYARMDTYARTTSKAPAPKGVALTLVSGSSDQNLMRLACAAAEKDILEFFERWGMTPDKTTREYAAQFEKETRAIYYVSDDSRVYSMSGESSLNADGTTEAVGQVDYAVNANILNQVDFTFSSTGIPSEDILGYEITRCMISGGEVEKQVVGFTTGNTFSDTITTVNNRTVSYEIVLIDKYLNRSAVKTLDQVKIEHDGSLDKTNWTVGTSGLEADDTKVDPDDENDLLPCEPTVESAALKAIDHDVNTVYEAAVTSNTSEMVMEFHKNMIITGLKYTYGESKAALAEYEIQIRSNGNWEKVAEGAFHSDTVQNDKGNTVYFGNEDGKYVSTCEADAVKLVIKGLNGKEISIAELDVLGVTGDNVDFRRDADGNSTPAIGTLKTAYKYGEKDTDVIPAGSTVFTGSYKGNAAYNVMILFDQDGNVVGGTDENGALKAQQIILSDVKENGNIEDTYDGTWIYWIEPGQNVDLTSIEKVRAELYRVNNALTNEGQRLVSDSLFETMPETLPEIEFTSNLEGRIDGE